MSDIAADVTLKDNSIEVKRIFASAVKRGLDAIGISAEEHDRYEQKRPVFILMDCKN